MVADPLARSYIHKDLTFPPLTKFQVKVKAFNSKGEGPFSLTAVIYSAQDGESSTHSQLSAPEGRAHAKVSPPRPLSPLRWSLQRANTLSVFLSTSTVAALGFIKQGFLMFSCEEF